MFDVEVPAGILAIMLVLTLQGCGHKGPLMLPPAKVPAPPAAASAAPASPAAASSVPASQPSPAAQQSDTSSPQPAKQP
jgi:predicted small lipoprotein YifL